MNKKLSIALFLLSCIFFSCSNREHERDRNQHGHSASESSTLDNHGAINDTPSAQSPSGQNALGNRTNNSGEKAVTSQSPKQEEESKNK